MRVVTVDDSMLVRKVMAAAFEDIEGIELVGQAADGASALKLLHETAPDLAVLDLVMPGMNGLALLRIVRTRYPQTKIIVISANLANPDNLKDVYEAGADHAMEKPFALESFRAVLTTVKDEFASQVNTRVERS